MMASLAVVPQASLNAQQPKDGSSPASRPNIVFMIADDCTYRDLGCYGGVNTPTPNIDRLASEGVRFTHFFQAAPMSSPTRQCLMTGRYPVSSGAYPNHARVRDDVTSVTHHMREQGYRVALQGKRHFEPLSVFDYEFLSGGGMDVNVDKVRPFIQDAASKQEPFCLFLCSHQPHTPWNMGDPSVYDPEKLILPSYWVDTPETRADYCRYLAEVTYMDGLVGQVMDLLDETGVADNTVFFFTSEQGNAFPFAKWTCYDMGLQTAMIVRWPGVTEPGSTCDALAEYVDVVPTFVDIAGGTPDKVLEGKSFKKCIEGKKNRHKKYVYAIHTTRGTINGTEGFGIRSVRDRRYLYIRNVNSDNLFRNATTDLGAPMWSSWVREGVSDPRAAELVSRYQKRPAEELYDTWKDPDDDRNLASERRYSLIRKRFSRKLDRWMEQQGDLGAETEMQAFDHQMKGQKGAQEAFSKAYRGKMFLADPYVYEEDGIYYVYGTGERDGIGVYRSIDLKNWEGLCGKATGGLALHKDDVDGNNWFWAPEVYKLSDGRYAMFFSAETRARVAFADSPLGPFKGGGAFTPDQNSIDNHLFIDEDGTRYMYWVRFGLGKGNEIRVATLSDDLQEITSDQVECIHAEKDTWETLLGKVTEGPFVLKHGGKYYLTYSGNDFHSQDYAVGYAVSDSPLGPWKRFEGNPILRRPQSFLGTGHHAFFTGADGKQMYIVFHAHPNAEKATPRQTIIAPCRFEERPGADAELIIDTENIIEPIIY